MLIAIRLNAGNDVNGNPRRAFVVMDSLGIVEVIDEGYEGYNAVWKEYPDISVVATFMVKPKEYRDRLKEKRRVR